MSTPPPPPPPPPPKPPIRPPSPPAPPQPKGVQPVSEARAEAIFNGAAALPGSAREEFLAVECRGNEALLGRVRVLLAAHSDVTDFLDEPEILPEIAAELTRLKPEEEGDRIGRYKLLQQIGEGGFGAVWMAEQIEPVSRKVALKIIKLGMDTKEIIGRFEQERQALAMMDHPNIAKVFDAGATQFGRPFFVMELVKGIPITQYCDESGLGTRERLALFGDVCSAINHAHQKGIIHRDIKPSNVLVTLYADKPVVKVIDFGIAKATLSKLTDKTLFTRFEQFIGTPVYMSPEQAALSAVDIDTRSDIYGLGILLYELITGKAPFDAKTLAEAGYDEMRRIIREVEPPKPSSRLSTVVGEERTSIAKARRVEPERISRLVEPDLDWIVMKAIEKDRTRRYETANGLKLDIQRFLADEPVNATPPSMGYQFRKFARRNRATLRVGTAIAAVLVGATIMSTWQAIRATRAEHEQARQRHEAELARELEAKMRRQAEARETIARAMLLLEAGNVDEVKMLMAGITPTTLDPTLANADSIFFVCKWYAVNHRPTEAMEAFRLGLRTKTGVSAGEKNSRIYVELACLLIEVGDTQAYERFQRDILGQFDQSTDYLLAYRTAQVGLLRPANEEVLVKLRRLVKSVEAADVRDGGMKSWQMFLIALFEYRQGDYSRAVQFGEETLKLAMQARLAACAYAVLATSEGHLNHSDKAHLALLKCQDLIDSAPTLKDQPGEYWNDWYDWWTARSVLREAQEFVKSPPAQEVRQIGRESGLAETNSAAIAERNLAINIRDGGDQVTAIRILRKALQTQRRIASGSSATARTLIDLACTLQQAGQLEEVESLFQEALSIYQRRAEFNDPEMHECVARLTEFLRTNEQREKAEAVLLEQYALMRSGQRATHRSVAWVLKRIVAQYRGWDAEKLVEWESRLREIAPMVLEEDTADATAAIERDVSDAGARSRRGEIYARAGRTTEAIADYSKAIELDPKNHLYYHSLAPLLVQSGDLDVYRRFRQQVIASFSNTRDPNTAERLAKDCLILPLSGPDLETVSAMADTALTAGARHIHFAFFQFSKSLAEYRQGHFQNAFDWAQKVLQKPGESVQRNAQAYAVLAMASHQLRGSEAAGEALAASAEILRTNLGQDDSIDPGDNWNDWIIARTLLREARELVEGQVPAKPAKP